MLLQFFRTAFSNSRIDFMKLHKSTILLSFICMALSLIFVTTKGLNLGIDFAGGILMEVKIEKESQKESQIVEIKELRSLVSQYAKDVQVQNIDEKNFLIRVAKSDENQQELIQKLQESISQKYSNIEYRKIDFVGPQVGSALIKNGIIALILSFASIMIYIWIRFDWQFGVGGIFALLHDAILTIGFFAITQLEFNLTSIASLLTIIGYSINDSVVIYDRIRENIKKDPKNSLKNLINSSTNSTLSRTVLTAGTTLFSLIALIIFGGEALKSFSIATFFGIAIGTYSSIYISAPILLYFDPRSGKTK